MATLAINQTITLKRIIGNREAIAARLLSNGSSVLDLAGKTILFRMVGINGGSTVVTGSTATIDSASLAHVSYIPSSSHVDTAGTFAMYFIDGSTAAATPQVRYPYDGAKFLLNIVSEDAV